MSQILLLCIFKYLKELVKLSFARIFLKVWQELMGYRSFITTPILVFVLLMNLTKIVLASLKLALHQNGVTECAIQTISSCAHIMLSHTSLYWLNQAYLGIRIFAVSDTVYLWNHTPRGDSSLFLSDLFSVTCFDFKSHLNRLHVWVCPVSVLDPKLKDGCKLPKSSPRTCLSQFLGYSREHLTKIGLIRSLSTGFVSPKVLVVNYDHFFTVPSIHDASLKYSDPKS